MTNALTGIGGPSTTLALATHEDLVADIRRRAEARELAGAQIDGQLSALYQDSVVNAPSRSDITYDGRPVGAAPASTPPPNQAYGQMVESAGPMYLVNIAEEDAIEFSDGAGGTINGPEFQAAFNNLSPQQQADLMAEYGLVQLPNGNLAVPVEAPSDTNVGNLIPGLGSAEAGMAQSMMDNLARSSFLTPGLAMASGAATPAGLGVTTAAMATAGIAPLVGAVLGAGAFSGFSGNSLGSIFGGMGGGQVSSQVNMAGWAAMESVMGAAGYDGAAHQARAIMKSHAREFKMDSMISMIDSGMPIEDLIFMFMAHLSDLYEDRLREKMREQQVSEKLQEKAERNLTEARLKGGLIAGTAAQTGGMISGASSLLGGLASLVPGVGAIGGALLGAAGNAVGGAITSAGDQAAKQMELQAIRENDINAKMNGNMKSGTVLASEVQMLLHKWKSMQEMMTNLLKAMHDMQMSVIRNIR